jgi:hypothetical protein
VVDMGDDAEVANVGHRVLSVFIRYFYLKINLL